MNLSLESEGLKDAMITTRNTSIPMMSLETQDTISKGSIEKAEEI